MSAKDSSVTLIVLLLERESGRLRERKTGVSQAEYAMAWGFEDEKEPPNTVRVRIAMSSKLRLV